MNQDLLPFEHCPSCGHSSSKADLIFNSVLLGQPCPILRCPNCGLVYKKFLPTESGLTKIYSTEYVHFKPSTPGLAEINSAKQKLFRCQRLFSTHRSPENLRILDIGCASGDFVNIARGLGYLAEGIDPYLPEELQSSYLQKNSPDNIPRNSYDIAVLLNVAEHLTEPKQMFSAIQQLLKPNGVMLLTCPYGDSLARLFHKANWGHLALDEHLLFWTPRSLTLMLRELGFHGKVSYRISGSPFPYGRVQLQPAVSIVTSNQNKAKFNTSPKKIISQPSLQARIWQFARLIQQKEVTANVVRSLVHLTHTGDYLEYAIGVGK